MTSRSERDVILEHALRDAENLEIAVKIGAAYHDLCLRVIGRFLEAVVRDLAPRLGEKWKFAIQHDGMNLAGTWGEFLRADYLGHPGGFHLVVGGDAYPKTVWFGARATSGSELRDHVRTVLQREYAPGKAGDPSFWWRYVDKAYSGWGGEEGTLTLYRQGEALNYFVSHLEQLARAVEKALSSE
jgi:hypothetical protein